jgi:hypothetical protein
LLRHHSPGQAQDWIALRCNGKYRSSHGGFRQAPNDACSKFNLCFHVRLEQFGDGGILRLSALIIRSILDKSLHVFSN